MSVILKVSKAGILLLGKLKDTQYSHSCACCCKREVAGCSPTTEQHGHFCLKPDCSCSFSSTVNTGFQKERGWIFSLLKLWRRRVSEQKYTYHQGKETNLCFSASVSKEQIELISLNKDNVIKMICRSTISFYTILDRKVEAF